jgi:DNA-directed RNA polymerase alpha subunit
MSKPVQFKHLSEEDGIYRFQLSNLNVSLSNALRRTILNDIPTYAFEEAKCDIQINTGRLHNEILKHRLSCIPIHLKAVTSKNDIDDTLLKNYVLEVDVQNDTESTIYVTTDDFKVKNKNNGKVLTEVELARIFPKNEKTQSPIIFARLRPRISDTIPGEHIKLLAELSIHTAEESSAFAVACTSAYSNTIDRVKSDNAWTEIEQKLKAEKTEPSEIEFQKKNFYLLDAQRYFEPNSFDFSVESIGVYDNHELVKMAAHVLARSFDNLAVEIEGDDATILNSQTTMANSFDFTLERGDYTLGKVIEYYLYTQHFEGDKTLSFCGFKKYHPHDTHAIIRLAFKDAAKGDKTTAKQYLKDACNQAKAFYQGLATKF